MNRKNGIDLFRLIATLFVICLHTNYGNLNKEYVDSIRLLSRWAVPFFFIASGYFLGQKVEKGYLDFKKIEKNITVLISIQIISTIIYLPKNIPNNISNILIGNNYHLWFIGSLLTSYILIWYFYFIKRSSLLPFIAVALLALALLTDSYDQLMGKKIEFSLFRFLMSVPFVYIGLLFSQIEKKYGLPGKKILIGLILLGVIVQFLEADFFFKRFKYDKYVHQLLIGTIILSFSLFLFSVKLDIKENVISKLGREHSLFVYLYHPLVLILVELVYKAMPAFNIVRAFSPFLIFTLTLFLSLVLYKFFRKVFNTMVGQII